MLDTVTTERESKLIKIIQQAITYLSTMSSADGSGHKDLARNIETELSRWVDDVSEIDMGRSPNNAIHADGSQDAVLEGDVYHIEYINSESIILTRRR